MMNIKKLSETFNYDEQDLPTDYEACGSCGYDHDYEYEEASKWHTENDKEQIDENKASIGNYSRFIDRIISQEHPKPKMLTEADSKQRLIARKYQDRPANKVTYK